MPTASNIFPYRAAQKRVNQLTTDGEKLSAQTEIAQRDEFIWQAAIPLRDVIQITQEVAELQNQIKDSKTEHAPLLRKLKTAARNYATALCTKLERLHKDEAFLAETEQEVRQQAITARTEAATQRQEAAVLNERARHIKEQTNALREARIMLEELGTIQADEDWRSACARLTHQQSLQDEEQRTLQHTLETLERDITRINETTATLIRSEGQVAKLEAEARNRLEAAQTERQVIEQDEYLQRYLELEIINLDCLDATAITQLHQSERAIEQQFLNLWMVLSNQDRVIGHLEAHELLPPSRDVEFVLKILDAAGITAWSGWEYLSRNELPANARTFIQRAPELVLGVIIRAAHYQKAQAILSSTNLNLDIPIVVAPQSAIALEETRTMFVVGPTSNAYFDRYAGQIELSERQFKQAQVEQELNAVRRELTELRVSIARLEQFRQEYPNSWIRQQQEVVDRAVEQQRVCQSQLAELAQEQQQLNNEINRQRQHQSYLVENSSTVREHLARLQAYTERFTAELIALEQSYSTLKIEVKSKQDAANQLMADAEEQDRQGIKSSAQVRKTLEEINLTKDEFTRIKYREGKPPASKAGDIQVLRCSYEQLVNLYERKLGADVLIALFDRAKREEREASQKLSSTLQEGITEKMVRTALNSLIDPSQVEQRYQKAVQVKVETEKLLQDKEVERKQARQELTNLEQECIKHSLMKGLEERLDAEENYDFIANNEEQRAQTLEVITVQRSSEAQITATHRSDLQHLIQLLSREQAGIKRIISSYEALLQVATNQIPLEFAWTAPADSEISSKLDTLEQHLKLAQQERTQLDRISTATQQAIQKWIDKIESQYGKLNLARRLKAWFEDDYERQCHYLQDELNLRLQQIEASLADADAHHNKIIEHTLTAAKVGVRILKSLETRSKLPASLQQFGERPFLKITLNDSTNPAEMKSRIAGLIDDIVKSATVPTGIEIVQQAARRLAKHIHLRMLFPDTDASPQYIAITEMTTKQSEGERLTSAILLYCTLVQLRTRERGQQMAITPLLLDNPIGRASRPKFLELQREVARAMNIQLIYTTGVNDFEAIRMLPNIIRLRNDRRDQTTGERLLEVDSSDGYLQETQLLFSDNVSIQSRKADES